MTGRSSAYWAMSNAAVLIARSLRHVPRSLDSLLLGVALPVLLMLLFVYVFGGAVNVGTAYVDYVVPGVIVLCAGYGASMTAVSVATDMVNGVIDRFRSMPILASAVLVGHVISSVVRNLVSTLLVIVVALLAGFRPTTSINRWLAAFGVIVLFVLALSWASAALGMLARTVEGASGITFVILFLPYLSSAFVPTSTMPEALRVISDHQPITHVIETIRGLLMGSPIGNSGWLAVLWSLGIMTVSFLAAGHLFRARNTR